MSAQRPAHAHDVEDRRARAPPARGAARRVSIDVRLRRATGLRAMDGVDQPVFQALLCLGQHRGDRLAIIQLGPSVGAILMGTPMIMFPLLAIQAWQGPPVTQAQTIGSIASMTALNGALWLYRLPIRFTPGTALLAFALGWLAAVMLVYLAEPPDWR
jgi:hypothetical protein